MPGINEVKTGTYPTQRRSYRPYVAETNGHPNQIWCAFTVVENDLAVQWVEHVWNVMAHAQKPDLVFQTNGRVHLNRRGSQFSRLLAVEECGSAGRPWIDYVPRYSARVAATLSNSLFPLHFPSHASPCAITFRTAATEIALCSVGPVLKPKLEELLLELRICTSKKETTASVCVISS